MNIKSAIRGSTYRALCTRYHGQLPGVFFLADAARRGNAVLLSDTGR